MLSENSTTTTARKATNGGCWNCTPQPTAAPARDASTATSARAQNDARMPAVVARVPKSSCERPSPALLTRPKSFSDSTGSTQGMALRMKPPTTASNSMPSRPPEAPPPADGWPAAGPAPPANQSPFAAAPPAPTTRFATALVVTGGRH
jgi:hypothetical protein